MGVPITYFEVLSPDAERAQKFYADLFGWKFNSAPALGEGYALVDTDAGGTGLAQGGIGKPPTPEAGGVKIYMGVDKLETYLDRAEKLGGRQVVPPTDAPGYGRIAIFIDPDGNQVGLFEQA